MKNDQEKSMAEVIGGIRWRSIFIPLAIGLLAIAVSIFFSIRTVAQESREPKRCVVIEVVVGGTRSDCGGWEAAKGEKLIMPAEVNKHLRIGDVFYFVWKETRWVAEIRSSSIIVVHSGESKTLHYNPVTHEEVRQEMADGCFMLTVKPKE